MKKGKILKYGCLVLAMVLFAIFSLSGCAQADKWAAPKLLLLKVGDGFAEWVTDNKGNVSQAELEFRVPTGTDVIDLKDIVLSDMAYASLYKKHGDDKSTIESVSLNGNKKFNVSELDSENKFYVKVSRKAIGNGKNGYRGDAWYGVKVVFDACKNCLKNILEAATEVVCADKTYKVIRNQSDFYAMFDRQYITSNYVLANDIAFSGEPTVNDGGRSFDAKEGYNGYIFEGNGFSINPNIIDEPYNNSGIPIKGQKYAGLFKAIGKNCVVRNFTIISVSDKSYSICEINYGRIEHIEAKTRLITIKIFGSTQSAGIATNNYGTIKYVNCKSITHESYVNSEMLQKLNYPLFTIAGITNYSSGILEDCVFKFDGEFKYVKSYGAIANVLETRPNFSVKRCYSISETPYIDKTDKLYDTLKNVTNQQKTEIELTCIDYRNR